MYFPVWKLPSWCKRFAVTRRRNCAVLPKRSASQTRLALPRFLGLFLVLLPVQHDQRYDTGQGYAEDARPHADVAVVAGLRRGAGGLDCRLLHVLADLTGAGLFPLLPGRRLFGDDPLPKVWDFSGTVTLPQHDHFFSCLVLVIVHSSLPVWLAGSLSPYLPPQSAQVASSVQVAVPPEQLTVSVWRSSRLQTRVWVSSPVDVHSPQSWSRAGMDTSLDAFSAQSASKEA